MFTNSDACIAFTTLKSFMNFEIFINSKISQTVKNPGVFLYVCPQPPLPVWNSPILIQNKTSQIKQTS